MPVLPCPLGSRCSEGDNGETWKTVDIDYEQAKELVVDHVMFAHPSKANNLNVNKGTEGGNFVNSSLHNPTFNIHTPAAAEPPTPHLRQQESIDVRDSVSTVSAVTSRAQFTIGSSITMPMPDQNSKSGLKRWACCLVFSIILTFLIVLLVDFILYHHIIVEVLEDKVEEKNQLSQIEFTRQQ